MQYIGANYVYITANVYKCSHYMRTLYIKACNIAIFARVRFNVWIWYDTYLLGDFATRAKLYLYVSCAVLLCVPYLFCTGWVLPVSCSCVMCIYRLHSGQETTCCSCTTLIVHYNNIRSIAEFLLECSIFLALFAFRTDLGVFCGLFVVFIGSLEQFR